MDNFNKILQQIHQHKNNRQLLIWGAWQRGKELAQLCSNHDIAMYGYIDSSKFGQQYDGFPVFDVSIIDKQKYYIAVSLVEHNSVFAILEQNGYQEWEDYVYPNQVFTIMRSRNLCKDKIGNSIKGFLTAGKKSYVELSGASSIEIGKNVIIDADVTFKIGWNSSVKIGNNVDIRSNCEIICQDNSEIIIGNHSIIRENTCIRAKLNSQIKIGEYALLGENTIIGAIASNHIYIAEHLLGASNVTIQCINGHSIMDLKNQRVHSSRKDIYIEKHVWLCWGCNILTGAKIGAHSVVGMLSLVNKKFPPHVMLAGNPARVVREEVDWCIDADTTYEEYIQNQDEL